MNHVGVLSALLERNMLPRIISGTSAGSIVAAACCTRTDDELPQLLNDFIHGDLNVFQDSTNPETVYDHIARLLKIGVWSDISYLTRVMQDLVGDLTFQEAYVLYPCGSISSVLESYSTYFECHCIKRQRIRVTATP